MWVFTENFRIYIKTTSTIQVLKHFEIHGKTFTVKSVIIVNVLALEHYVLYSTCMWYSTCTTHALYMHTIIKSLHYARLANMHVQYTLYYVTCIIFWVGLFSKLCWPNRPRPNCRECSFVTCIKLCLKITACYIYLCVNWLLCKNMDCNVCVWTYII